MKSEMRQRAALLLILATVGCSDQVRVKDSELIGVWVTRTNSGREELALQADKTYLQTFTSATRQFTHRGTWKSSAQFLGGSEIELANANVSEDEPSGAVLLYGDLNLQVYRLDGKLKLARNAAFDWYYERER